MATIFVHNCYSLLADINAFLLHCAVTETRNWWKSRSSSLKSSIWTELIWDVRKMLTSANSSSKHYCRFTSKDLNFSAKNSNVWKIATSDLFIFGAKIQILEKLKKRRKLHPLIFGAKVQIFGKCFITFYVKNGISKILPFLWNRQ